MRRRAADSFSLYRGLYRNKPGVFAEAILLFNQGFKGQQNSAVPVPAEYPLPSVGQHPDHAVAQLLHALHHD